MATNKTFSSRLRPVSAVLDALADSAYVRQAQLVRNPKRPDEPTLLPFSAATLWRKVAAKTFPAPARLSAGVTAWKMGEIRAWLEAQTHGGDEQ